MSSLQPVSSVFASQDSFRTMRDYITVYSQRELMSLQPFFNQQYTDCLIKCGSREWKAHKSILCPRNDYFKAAFEGSFAEGSTYTINWDDEDPWAAVSLLVYIYTYRYPQYTNFDKSTFGDLAPPSSKWRYHWGLMNIADKRQAPDLKNQARQKLFDTMRDEWSEDAFIDMVPLFWDHNDHDVKRFAVERALNYQDDLVKKESFLDMLAENDDFMKRWVSKLVRQHRQHRRQYHGILHWENRQRTLGDTGVRKPPTT